MYQIQSRSTFWTSYWWKCWSWRWKTHILYTTDIPKRKSSIQRQEWCQESKQLRSPSRRWNSILRFKKQCGSWGVLFLLHMLVFRAIIRENRTNKLVEDGEVMWKHIVTLANEGILLLYLQGKVFPNCLLPPISTSSVSLMTPLFFTHISSMAWCDFFVHILVLFWMYLWLTP